jgi:excisionase family DNA binding protein
MDDIGSESPWLTPVEAATYLNTSVRHVRELVYKRDIAYTKCGRLLRFRRDDLERYLQARRVEPRGEQF